MKKLIFLIVLVSFFSCNNSSKSHKIKPDTCWTQIEFKNIYTGGYPAPPAISAAVRIIKDSAFDEGEDKLVHRLDTTYYIPYITPIKDTKGIHLKKKTDPLLDSTSTDYYPITTKDLIRDDNHTDPLKQANPVQSLR